MAQQIIRDTERDLGVNCLGLFASCLTIQCSFHPSLSLTPPSLTRCVPSKVMDANWGSGDPRAHLKLPDWDRISYDDHNCSSSAFRLVIEPANNFVRSPREDAQWMVHGQNATREGYLEYLCSNTRPSTSFELARSEATHLTIVTRCPQRTWDLHPSLLENSRYRPGGEDCSIRRVMARNPSSQISPKRRY